MPRSADLALSRPSAEACLMVPSGNKGRRAHIELILPGSMGMVGQRILHTSGSTPLLRRNPWSLPRPNAINPYGPRAGGSARAWIGR